MKRSMAVFALVLAVPLGAGQLLCAAGAQSQQPKKKITVHMDYVTPSGGLETLWNAAELVVIARPLSAKQHKRTKAGGHIVPTLIHEVEIREVLKGSLTAETGQRIPVTQAAGVVEELDRTVEVDPTEFPLLRAGSKYLMFLSKVPGNDELVFVAGPYSVYLLENGKALKGGKQGEGVDESVLRENLRRVSEHR